MKKIIIAIISAMILMPTMADAQIIVTDKYKSETLLSMRMGVISLNYDGGYYITMRTSNQFDSPMILPLGKDKRESIKTIESLIDITKSIKKDEVITITTAAKEKFRISRVVKNSIVINADRYAGYASTNKSELSRMLDALQFAN